MSAPAPSFIIVTDPGPDPDDVKVLVAAATLQRRGQARISAVICNGGGQARERAILGKAVLRATGAPNVRVGIGSHGVDRAPQPHEYALAGCSEVDPECDLEDGGELFLSVMREAPPASLVVQVQAGLTDVATAMGAEPELFRRKVVRVSVMGGLQRVDQAEAEAAARTSCPTSAASCVAGSGTGSAPADWEADTAQNNVFDIAAAKAVYSFCLTHGLPMNVVGRDAVPMLPMALARSFAEMYENPLLRYLDQCQSLGLVQLWSKVCKATELPARCNKEWFFTTFCGVSAEEYRDQHAGVGAEANIANYLNGSVKPYDVVSFMTNLPGWTRYFDFESAAVDVNGTRHSFFLSSEQKIEASAVAEFLGSVFADVGKLGEAGSQPGLAKQGKSKMCAIS